MATAVLLVFAVILAVGLLLRMRTKRALEQPPAEPTDLEALADPSRWPAPPHVDDAESADAPEASGVADETLAEPDRPPDQPE